jgi:hypothetical protein
MDPIQKAIEYIESREVKTSFCIAKSRKDLGVNRTALSRRHQGKTHSNGEARQRQLLNPQQEHGLVRYIEKCTRRGLPPTRKMVQNLASAVAKWEVSES